MSFSTALSGLKAATLNLGVTSNNIANTATTGFKYSRPEFSDLIANSQSGNNAASVGNGVRVSSVNQQFKQGNLEFTDNSLDISISGQGFFIVSQPQTDGEVSYTRAGQFRADSNGYVSNSNGQLLQAFPVNEQGTVTSTSLSSTIPIALPTSVGTPVATTEISIGLNLDASRPALDPAAFDPAEGNSYAHSTSSTVFDSLGASHVLSYYFIPDAPGSATNSANNPNQWAVFSYLDGAEIDMNGGPAITHSNSTVTQNAAILQFNPDGSFASSTPAEIESLAVPLTNGANPLSVRHDFANNATTQFSIPFAVNKLDSNGFSTGRLSGLNVSTEGLISANFSNGMTAHLGQIALADFPNNQGLSSLGDASWAESIDAGSVITGIPKTGRFGQIQSGALEASNVNLTAQLVNLITAQRDFQANAKSIETANTIVDTIIQMR